ncbi:YraN family protein [Chondrinema litorale]|nr:YraN family protein [Chondrinema litorale]UZR92694.1 YraN family protein [Chondrinema litorale]
MEKGKIGENLAVNYLSKKGFKILERNFRYKKAEIDIIASNEKFVLFIEVKTRSKTTFGYPEEFVSEQQEERIMNAATHFLETTGAPHQFIRFDIISIIKNSSQQELVHIEDAFH